MRESLLNDIMEGRMLGKEIKRLLLLLSDVTSKRLLGLEEENWGQE